MVKLKVAVLISGRGSNMKALIDAQQRQQQQPVDFEIALVLSNRPSAAGLEVAEAAGIDTIVIDHQDYQEREPFDRALDQAWIIRHCRKNGLIVGAVRQLKLLGILIAQKIAR